MNQDVIIAGGGIVGGTLGLLLADAGIRVSVIEQGSPEKFLDASFDGRVSAISYASYLIYKNAGVWAKLEAKAEPIWEIRVVEKEYPSYLHFDHSELGPEPLGFMAENRFIRKAIHEAILENPAIQYITASEVESFSDAGASVTAHVKGDGDIAAQLLVAADGRSSGLRAASGIQHKEIRYGQIALVCVVEHSEEHAGIALEKFVPAGPFAVLPMVGRMSGVVWTVEEKFAADYMALSDADFLRELNKLFAGYLGEIKLVSRLWGYPLSLLHAAEYWKGRLALVGDAAHGVHPIAGQGANLGLRDAAVLADLLGKQFSLGLDLGSSTLLERYNQWRRFDVFSMMAATDGLNRLFSNDFPPLKLARNIGLAAVNRVPPLKNVFMKQAMGLMGKLPKAMQG